MIKITFLGTSDSVPTAKRNHTGILITHEGENILIDCGEGIQRQIRKARLNPCKITKILITHWHTDHILGIPGLLKTLNLSRYNKTMNIYGPKGTKRLMGDLLRLFAIKIKYHTQYPIKVKEVDRKFLETDEFYIEAREMIHGVKCNAYCFVLKGQRRIDKKKLKKYKIPSGPHLAKLKKGKDIKYKGKKYLAKNLTYVENSKKICVVMDTLKHKGIVPFAKDSDLLICEASSVIEEGAKRYKHMMAKHAAEIAKKAKVKRLILSHISPRVEKDIKKQLGDAKKIFKNVSIAEDLDSVKL